MYVDELLLHDFRAIASSRNAFVHPNAAGAEGAELPNINVLLGVNGGGKSSVLKAIALASAAARDEPVPPDSADWPRYGGEGTLRVGLRWSEGSSANIRLATTNLQLERGGSFRSRGAPPIGLLIGYGSVRVVGELNDELLESVDLGLSPLLFASAKMMPLEAWIDRSGHQDEVGAILNAVLPDDVEFVGERHKRGDYFTQRGLAIPRAALSDGIRSFLAWICDLLWRLDRADATRLDEVAGVVLVDEIDQRMHPGWQQALINRLGSALPAIQFICTAHSPLIPSGLRRRNLLLVEPDPRFVAHGATTLKRMATEEVYGRTADQVLQSPYFDLVSTRSETFRRELRAAARRAQDNMTGREAALEFMRLLAEPDTHEPNDQ